MFKIFIRASLVMLLMSGVFHEVSFAQVENINAVLNQRKIKSHLEFLASDELEGRKTGEKGNHTAARYIATQLYSFGLETALDSKDFLQQIVLNSFVPPDSASMQIGDDVLNFPGDFIVINGSKQHMTAPIQFVNFGSEDDLKDIDLRFKVAVAICGDGQQEDPRKWIELSRAKRKAVAAKGAVGLIEIYQSTMIPWNLMRRLGTQSQLSVGGDNENGTLSHFWLGSSDSEVLAALKSGKSSIQLNSKGVTRTDITSSNVVGMVRGTDPKLKEEYIVLSAHYDHVGIGRPDADGDTIYNGARDNAVGTTAVMMAAEYFAKHPPKRSILFVLFTGEEVGLLGSKYFVDHSPVALSKIKYCFNIDNGGYNDTTIVSVIGLTRTEAESDLMAACKSFGLEAIEDPAKEQGLFDRSDNVNFAVKGIPAPTFSLGFRAFDQEIFKYYHQPSDEVESLNMNYIEKYMKAFVLSAIKISESPKVASWLQGDKYYEVGQKLYGEK